MAAFEWKEMTSELMSLEWDAEDVLRKLREIQSATPLNFQPSDSFKMKVDMLEARMAVIVEDIAKLQIEGENV